MPFSTLERAAKPHAQTPVNRYQIYGERCSGTHYIIKLLENNITSASFTEEFGFKHWFRDGEKELPEDLLVVIIAREPFSWSQSFHRQPWHAAPEIKELDYSSFIRAEWRGGVYDEAGEFQEDAREHDPLTGDRFKDIWGLREAKLLQWTALPRRQRRLLVDYDTARQAPEIWLDMVCESFGLTRKADFVPIETYKGLGGETFRGSRYPDISDEDRDFIRSRLNADLEAQFFGK
jgi:hypothetical protein